VSSARNPRISTQRPVRATLSDVARDAGVSVMTVSNFVRGKAVRVQTRKRVEEAIARLNYRPNVSARNLRLSEEYSVGIVIADRDPAFLNDPFISRLVSGLSNYLSGLDYTLDIQGVSPERFDNATILKKIGNDAMCAILCGPKDTRMEHLAKLQRLGQPIVVFQEVFSSRAPNVAVVRQDDMSGGKQLGQHLLERRARSLVFVRPALDWCALEQREEGLRRVLEEADPKVQVTKLISRSEGFDDVQEVVRAHLAHHRPDAIVGATDSMAVAALKATELSGIKVPRELMICGFNGFDVWRYTTPTLTTVVSPAYEMGRLAGELVIQKLRMGTFPRRNVILPVQLQVGESTNG
jgi:LacI family transcriptional regulator